MGSSAMKKSLRTVSLLFAFILILTVTIPRPVHASPAGGFYDSSPTSNVISGGLSVPTPTQAYDGDNGTSATFDYGNVGAGKFEVRNFTIAGAPNASLIAFVDIKIKYTAEAATDDTYMIKSYVSPSTSYQWLVTRTSAAHSVPAHGCDVWTNQVEPNDGVWSWTDISNIRIVIEGWWGPDASSDGKEFDCFEVWVTVYYYIKPTISVDPTSIIDPTKVVDSTFNININITNVDDLYGWEYKLAYNGTILNATSVTEGTFLNASGAKNSFFKVLNFSDTLGLIWVTSTLTGDVLGTSGNGTLSTIGFKVKAVGSCTLDLQGTKLAGYAKTVWSPRIYQQTHNVVDGYFNNIGAVPEFPFGATIEIALAMSIIYVWWRKKRKVKLYEPHTNYPST